MTNKYQSYIKDMFFLWKAYVYSNYGVCYICYSSNYD